jgi:hypothetical protein
MLVALLLFLMTPDLGHAYLLLARKAGAGPGPGSGALTGG